MRQQYFAAPLEACQPNVLQRRWLTACSRACWRVRCGRRTACCAAARATAEHRSVPRLRSGSAAQRAGVRRLRGAAGRREQRAAHLRRVSAAIRRRSMQQLRAVSLCLSARSPDSRPEVSAASSRAGACSASCSRDRVLAQRRAVAGSDRSGAARAASLPGARLQPGDRARRCAIRRATGRAGARPDLVDAHARNRASRRDWIAKRDARNVTRSIRSGRRRCAARHVAIRR